VIVIQKQKLTIINLGISYLTLTATREEAKRVLRRILFRCSVNDRFYWESIVEEFRRVNFSGLFAPELPYQ